MKTGLSCAALAQSMEVATNITNRRTCYSPSRGQTVMEGTRAEKKRCAWEIMGDRTAQRQGREGSLQKLESFTLFGIFARQFFYRHHLRQKRCSASRVFIEFMKHRGAMVQWETEDGAVRGPASAKTCLASAGKSCMWPSNVTRRCVYARGH